MKKKVFFVMASVLTLALAGCAADKPATSSSSSSTTTTSSKAEATSGASETMTYAKVSDLKDSYDIVIVGAGGAGMTAAIEAKEKGMNPVIFEKMPTAGGNTLKASGGMNASNTKIEKEEGVQDSNDLFYEDTLKGGKGTNDKALLRYFVDHSADAIDWLDSIGIELNNLTISGGMSAKRMHRPADGSAVGGYLVDGLERNIKERNIPIFVNSDVTAINEKDGVVNGVNVTIDQAEKKTISAKAVIVTTGGFGANKEMIAKYRPDLKDYVTTNQKGSTGDGIQMIEKLGGATVDLDKIQVHPTVVQSTGYLITEAVRGEGAILVNKNAKRFVNELETRDNVSAAELKQPGSYAYVVFDQTVRDSVKAINTYKEKGYVIEADSYKALAKKMGVSEDTFEKTMNTWNEDVKNKKDSQFGRTTAMEHDLSKGPFYAIKVAPGIHHTMGGVKINTETQVLKKDGSAIPALYAAGEVTGGLHGSNRIGGNAVADVVIFGRQAGTQAAEYVKAHQ
jgi:fumarate reductase flavoprotein subunit